MAERYNRKVELVFEQLTAEERDQLWDLLTEWARQHDTLVTGSILTVDEDENEIQPTQDQADPRDCAHYHWINADPWGSSSSGAGCLRSGSRCFGCCKWYPGVLDGQAPG